MLIIVHGMVGVGKTTLAKNLSRDLGVSLLSQDSIKEFYADELNCEFNELESKALGRAAKFSLIEVARELTDTGMSLIIEGAFHADTANQFFASINTNESTVMQVSVVCDFDVARARFEKRIKNQERHSVHTDSVFEELSKDALLHKYRPLGLEGVKTITYDTTTNYGDYEQLLKTIRTLANN